MHPRASELIHKLELAPHPEGGFYREIWRSQARIAADHRPSRSALTAIYYLLIADAFSAWHRVRSDEVWHWYEGEPLELLLAAPDFRIVQRMELGPVRGAAGPVATVPADWWQAARPLGAYALCGCTVAPGFEFEDFVLLRDDPVAVASLCSATSDLTALL